MWHDVPNSVEEPSFEILGEVHGNYTALPCVNVTIWRRSLDV